MNLGQIKFQMCIAAALVAAALSLPAPSRAQGISGTPVTPLSGLNAADQYRVTQEKELTEQGGDPKEIEAYKSFHSASEPAKKIKLGEQFINKWPTSKYSELVYQELTQAYYAKQDLPDFYSYSEKGIAKFPDDVSLLAMAGWVIPRAYDHNDPDGDRRLTQAVTYEQHAIDVLDKMQKPAGVTDEQFTQYTHGESSVAHSGLGVVYFRQEQYEKSAAELKQATTGTASPDPTDLFILGADFENLGQYKEAADTFTRCAQMAGTFQDRCKQAADGASKQAAAK